MVNDLNESPHVLMVTEDYPPGLLTGIGRHVEELADALARIGTDVCVIKAGATASESPRANFAIVGAEAPQTLTALDWLDGPFSLPRIFHNNLAMIHRALAMDCSRFDLVHVHDIFAAQAGFTIASILGLPTVLTKHFGLPPSNSLRPLPGSPRDTIRYFARLEEWSMDKADHIVAVSEHMRKVIVGRNDRLRETCTVIRNCTSIGSAEPRQARTQCRQQLADRINAGRPLGLVLLQVGRVVRTKGPDIAVHALALLARHLPESDPRLVLIGSVSTSSRHYLVTLARNLGVAERLHFGGPQTSRAALADLYCAGDMIVVPSRSESFGLVVAEATSLRRLVLAAEVGGITEQLVHMRNGLLFRPGGDLAVSGRALAELVIWACANPADAALIAEFGPLHGADTYAWGAAASKVASLYRDVIDRSGHQRRPQPEVTR